MELERILGSTNEQNEWKDGILTVHLRNIHLSNKKQWVVLDCSAKRQWNEVMHSLMGSNKKLSLKTGESVPMDASTKIITETSEVQDAHPGILQHSYIIYMQSTNIVQLSYKLVKQVDIALQMTKKDSEVVT